MLMAVQDILKKVEYLILNDAILLLFDLILVD